MRHVFRGCFKLSKDSDWEEYCAYYDDEVEDYKDSMEDVCDQVRAAHELYKAKYAWEEDKDGLWSIEGLEYNFYDEYDD